MSYIVLTLVIYFWLWVFLAAISCMSFEAEGPREKREGQ